jgi:glycine cleavage system H protein
MARITALNLRKEGEPITRSEPFGYAEGDKMSVDLIAPVSGTVILINSDIWAGGGDNDGLDLITSEPYFNGWLSVVQISKPEELTELITPETYMELNAKPVV